MKCRNLRPPISFPKSGNGGLITEPRPNRQFARGKWRALVMHPALVLPCVLLCLSVVSPSAPAKDKEPDFRGKVQTEVLGDAPQSGEGELCTSPDGRRFAFWTRAGGKVGCIVDGELAGKHDGQASNEVYFSPDSQHAAWIAEEDGKQTVVCDGQPGKAYSGVPSQSICFNPASGEVVYVAMEGWEAIVVAGGKEIAKQHSVVDHRVAVSPDGKRLAWLRKRKPDRMYTQSNVVLVVDGEETGPEYANADGESLTFSPDSRRIAFVATIDKEQCCVVDGKPGEGQYSIKDITFSPDSQRVAYVAGNGMRYYVIIDGQKGPEVGAQFDGRFCFSPDSKHFACPASGGLYLDGKVVAELEGGLDHRRALAFSPDNSKLALGLKMHRGPNKTLIFGVDGSKIGEHLQPVDERPLAVAWSPDSRSVAWFGMYSAFYNDQLIGTYFGKYAPGKFSLLPRPLRVGFDQNGIWFVAVNDGKVLRVTAQPAGTAPERKTASKRKTQPEPAAASQPAAGRNEAVAAQPDEAGPATAADAYRNWTDATGKYQVEAKLLARKDGWVLLETKDGRKISLPISKLSPADQVVIGKSH